jgi:hypothetical protein
MVLLMNLQHSWLHLYCLLIYLKYILLVFKFVEGDFSIHNV